MSESPTKSFFELNLLIQRSGFFGSCFSPVVSFALVINATLHLICLGSGETVCPLSDPDFDKFLICGHLCLSWASLKILVSILIVLRVKCSNHVAFETGQEKLMCLWLALQFLTFLVLWPMLKHCNHYTGLGFQLLISVVSLVEIVLATYWPLDVKYFVKS